MRKKLQTLYLYQMIREFHTLFSPQEIAATSSEHTNKIICYKQGEIYLERVSRN